jgi:Ca-activated chloride channel family protein
MADEAGGLAAFISQGDDFTRQAQAFRRKLMRPAVSNLQIAFSGGDVRDVEPVRLPDLYHGAALRMYGRYGKSGQVKVTLKGDVQGQAFEKSVDIDFPEKDDANPEIERMWAWKRVDRLLGDARQQGNTSPVVSEVVKLCEDYSIASEYASFIVLENDAEYQRWKIERRNANRMARDRQAHSRLLVKLEQARNDSLTKLGPQQKGASEVVSTDALPVVLPTTERNFTPQAATPPTPGAPAASPGRGFDLNLPTLGGGGGGGAIDPISAAIGLGLASAAAARYRRKSRVKAS